MLQDFYYYSKSDQEKFKKIENMLSGNEKFGMEIRKLCDELCLKSLLTFLSKSFSYNDIAIQILRQFDVKIYSNSKRYVMPYIEDKFVNFQPHRFVNAFSVAKWMSTLVHNELIKFDEPSKKY